MVHSLGQRTTDDGAHSEAEHVHAHDERNRDRPNAVMQRQKPLPGYLIHQAGKARKEKDESEEGCYASVRGS